MEQPSPHLEGNSVTRRHSVAAHAGGVTSFVQNVFPSCDDVMQTGKGDAAERPKTRIRIPVAVDASDISCGFAVGDDFERFSQIDDVFARSRYDPVALHYGSIAAKGEVLGVKLRRGGPHH